MSVLRSTCISANCERMDRVNKNNKSNMGAYEMRIFKEIGLLLLLAFMLLLREESDNNDY